MALIFFASASKAEDIVKPSDFVKTWAETLNENSPKDQCVFYDQSEKTEMLVSAGIRHRGYKAIKKAYRDDQLQLKYYDSEATKITSRLLGDTAVVTFEHKFKIRFNADDSQWQTHIRTSSVLRRAGNTWKIVLEHSSPIHGTERMTRLPDE